MIAKCKVEDCKYPSIKKTQFCGRHNTKYLKGLLSDDGVDLGKNCKAVSCNRPAKVRGWCGWCVKKYQKGFFLSDGTKSTAAVKLDKRKEMKISKRSVNERRKQIIKVKKELSSLVTLPILKILQEREPETKAIFFCEAIQIQMCTATCFARLFANSYIKRECKKCTVHSDKFQELKEFCLQ